MFKHTYKSPTLTDDEIQDNLKTQYELGYGFFSFWVHSFWDVTTSVLSLTSYVRD